MDDLRNVIDTLLNVGVFAFIGLLVWLYFKKEVTDGESETPEGEQEM